MSAPCLTCGKPLPSEAVFCPQCGNPTPIEVSGETRVRRSKASESAETSYADRVQRALGADYRVLGLLGRGGFAEVHAAFDVRLKREVAVKVLRYDLVLSESLLERFRREAESVAQLRHPHIIPIYSVGEAEGLAFFVMPLIRGQSLRARLEGELRLPVLEARRILAECASALAAAHRAGVVHRDIKPDNILLDGDEGHVLLTDFGIAKAVTEGEQGLTGTGVIIGTPLYMSPEQASGQSTADPRQDIYSLGVVGYHMLAGHPPFDGSTAEVVVKHIATQPTHIAEIRPETPGPLAEAIMRCLRKAPADRWATAAELVAFLSSGEAMSQELPTGPSPQVVEIASAVQRGECVLFLGLETPFGAPPGESAEHSIREHLARAHSGETSGERLPAVAQALELERGRPEMLRLLADAVRNAEPQARSLYRRLARIGVPVIITTTYDVALEEELVRAGRRVRRMLDFRSFPEEAAGDLVVRLFGALDADESMVVTQDDLWQFFSDFSAAADGLKSLFATRALVFVGYDVSDALFRQLFLEVARFRMGRTGGCHAVSSRGGDADARWAARRGLSIVPSSVAGFLDQLDSAVEVLRAQAPAEQTAAAAAPLPNRPYKFLNYFESEDERIFFGRDAEVRKLVSKIHSYPLNLLYAPSGTGKTSLIFAGLLPALRREGYAPVYARVYDDPEGEIRRAALHCVGGAQGASASELPDLLPEISARLGLPIVVFLDQLEELFIRYDQVARARFARTLQATLAAGGGRVRFVLSLREDFLAHLSEFREAIPSVFHNEFRLESLSTEASRAAIVEPARLFGLEVEEALVERLIGDLTREGIDPPQLQIVCDTLYDAIPEGEKRITLASYTALGETRKILADYLERVLRELEPDERTLARELLKQLVTSEQTKTVSRVVDLARVLGQPEPAVQKVLADFVNRRLIRQVQREEGTWFELAHEYLVEEIGRWLSDKDRELKKVRELLEQAVRNHRNLGMLIPPAQLKVIHAQEALLNLSRDELQLLRESDVAQSKQRRLFIGLAAAAALLLLLGGVAWRWGYLHNHIYLQSTDREMVIQWQDDYRQTSRFEIVVVHDGSPNRWFIDGPLGYPRKRYETDFDARDIDPTQRDRLKAGLAFPAETDVDHQLEALMRPEFRLVRLASTGRLDSVASQLDSAYGSRLAQGMTLDTVTATLGTSGLADTAFVANAVRNAFRPSRDYFFFGGSGLDNKNGPLAQVLLNLPPAARRERLLPFERSEVSAPLTLPLLGLFGTAADERTVLDLYGSREPSVRNAAASALPGLLGCRGVELARNWALDPQIETWNKQGWLFALGACRGPQLLRDLQTMLSSARGPNATLVIEAMYAVAGEAAAPIMRQAFRANPGAWAGGLEEGAHLVASDMREGLTSTAGSSASAMFAEALARLGDFTGLWAAFRIASDTGQAEGRAQALETLRWARHPRIRAIALQALAGGAKENSGLRRAAALALAWYDDDSTTAALLDAVSTATGTVRFAATAALGLIASPRREAALTSHLSDPRPAARIAAAIALQRLQGRPYTAVFALFLTERGDTTTDFFTILASVQGLAAGLLLQPADSALACLSSPDRETRVAALTAISQHADTTTLRRRLGEIVRSGTAPLATVAARAVWSQGLTARTRAVLLAADSSMASGLIQRAMAQQELAYGYAFGVNNVASGALAPFLRGNLAARTVVDRIAEARLYLAMNRPAQASRYLYQGTLDLPLAQRAALAASPALAPLRSRYDFQVGLGLQTAREASDADLTPPRSATAVPPQ